MLVGCVVCERENDQKKFTATRVSSNVQVDLTMYFKVNDHGA